MVKMVEWKKIRLGDLIKTNISTYSEKEGWNYVNYLDTGNIIQNSISEIQHIRIGVDKLPSRARRKVKNGNIIYSTVRPNQLHYGYIRSQPDNLLVSTGFVVIEVDEKIAVPEYIYYFLTQNDITEYLHAIADQSTSAYPSIKPSDIEELSIDLPPINEQKKIVGLLNVLDEKIKKNNELNNNLLQQTSSIFRHWFTNNPSLDKMEQVPLADLCIAVTKGTTPTTLGKPFVSEGINFIKAESILDDHTIDRAKFAFIDSETNNLLKRSIIRSGDIVFTIAGTLGRFALINDSILPANTNQAVAIIRTNQSKVTPEYLYSFFLGNWHNDYYTKRIQQAVQANLSLGTIKSLPIPILSEKEMHEYLGIIKPIITMTKSIELEILKLRTIRDTLLPQLLSGQLEVSDIEI